VERLSETIDPETVAPSHIAPIFKETSGTIPANAPTNDETPKWMIHVAPVVRLAKTGISNPAAALSTLIFKAIGRSPKKK